VGGEAAAHNPDLSDEDRARLRKQGRWILPAMIAPVAAAVSVAWVASHSFLTVLTAAFVSLPATFIVALPIGFVLDRRERQRRAGIRR
jgi:uncharacterized membrane protein